MLNELKQILITRMAAEDSKGIDTFRDELKTLGFKPETAANITRVCVASIRLDQIALMDGDNTNAVEFCTNYMNKAAAKLAM